MMCSKVEGLIKLTKTCRGSLRLERGCHQNVPVYTQSMTTQANHASSCNTPRLIATNTKVVTSSALILSECYLGL